MNITCKRVGYNQVSAVHKCPSGDVSLMHSTTTPEGNHEIVTSTPVNEEEGAQTKHDARYSTQYSTMVEITSKITERQTTGATSTTKAQSESTTTTHAVSSTYYYVTTTMAPTTEITSQPESSIIDVTTVENTVTSENYAEMTNNEKESLHIAWIGEFQDVCKYLFLYQ